MYIIILGAGISGLSASYHLYKHDKITKIIEKDDTYGGLCNSFCIDGFIFDTFAHISFDNDPYTFSMLEGKTPYLTHSSKALNYCDGYWVKNPVQNNLLGLSVKERINIIGSYLRRNQQNNNSTYEDWLESSFGAYFASKYPGRYTRKYWTVDADRLGSQWIKGRMTTPNFKEIIKGALKENNEVLHYSKEARYPKHGGFKEFLHPLAQGADIIYNTYVKEIDPVNKVIALSDGEILEYENIISTIPLPELINVIKDVPESIRSAADSLDHTSGAMISIGLNRSGISPSLWFYIYDEDILPARVYSPDWKSPDNVPKGCSAIQAEVYFSKYKPLTGKPDEIKEKVVDQILRLKLFKREDIIFSDIRYKEYANVMFTPMIYSSRDKIHSYLDEIGINYAGRWGMWDYLWIGQSFRSGRDAAMKIIKAG